MAFNDLEISIFGGKPVELYQFSVLGAYWRYTTEDRVVTFNGADYAPMAGLKRGSIKVTQNVEKGEQRIQVRGDSEIAREYLISPPSEPVGVRIFSKHRGDPDYIIRWRGRVQNCAWEENTAFATLLCVQANTSLKQPGLRRSYQYSCPYDLYGPGCKVNRSAYEVIGEVIAINGLFLAFDSGDSFPDGYFAGGYFVWEGTTGRQETRMITASTGSIIQSQLTTIGLTVGDIVRFYPGCNHSIQTCYTKFNNAENFGGMPFIPTTNPFAGATMF
jgi:uncharacterized phage protein (TIGR02218 family)